MALSPRLFRLTASHSKVFPDDRLFQLIMATAELCGQAISTPAASLLASDLASFEQSAVDAALKRCRFELRGRLHIGEILARIDDGRPEVEEAWDMLPKNEAESVIWTREMAHAWGHALPLMQCGDRNTAHRVFRESYTQAVLLARCQREAICWTPSLGTDPAQREQVLRDAVKKERLPAFYVEQLLPNWSLSTQARQLLTQVRFKKIP